MVDAKIEDLVRKALQEKESGSLGNRAFSEIVKRFQNFVFGYIYAIVRDRNISRDIEQSVFILAFNHLEQLRRPVTFPGWIKQIARRECLKALADQKKHALPLDNVGDRQSESILPDDFSERNDFRDRIHLEIQKLPEILRIPFLLYYMEDCSVQEIALFLMIQTQTVKKRLQRARESFKNGISDDFKEYLKEIRPSRDHRLEERIDFYTAFDTAAENARISVLEQVFADGFATDNQDAVSRVLYRRIIREDRYRKKTAESRGDTEIDLARMMDTAAQETQLNLMEQLLADGYDIDKTDSSGRSLRHWAAENNHPDMKAFLKNRNSR